MIAGLLRFVGLLQTVVTVVSMVRDDGAEATQYAAFAVLSFTLARELDRIDAERP